MSCEIKMPVMYHCRRTTCKDGMPVSVQIPTTCEDQAQRNHGQSLARLKERGGLSLCEAIALMESRKYKKMTIPEVVDKCREYFWI